MKRVLIAGFFLTSCAKPDKTNVLLITVDTLRADHVSSYGVYERTTPEIDALARDGVRFERVLTPIPLTLPAHSSLLTGTIPPVHGLHDNLSFRLADEELTLAELLKDHGYTTGAIVSSFVLDSQFNLDQGFETYDDEFEEEHKIASISERKGDETSAIATRWLEAHRGDPFFLFVHYYDPHDDYDPPEPFASRYDGDPYTGEVAFTDQMIGRVLKTLKELDLYDSTIVVVTGDHGEMLGEHDELTHGYFIYQGAVRVPLVIKAPGIDAGVVRERVGLIDVAPTIAGLLGLELASADGRDLSRSMQGETRVGRRELYLESMTANRYYGINPLSGLVAGDWKYIRTTRPELYNLAKDPGETTNVIAESPRVAEGMKNLLEQTLQTSEAAAREASLDESSRKRLASLGYLSGASDAAGKPPELSGSDPKDWIHFYRNHQKLEKLVGSGNYDEARALTERMLAEWPEFVAGHLQLARIDTETGRLADAAKDYQKALALDPDNAGAQYNLANILVTLGDTKRAVQHYRAALQLDPTLEDAQRRLDELRLDGSDPAAAIAYYRNALARATGRERAVLHHRLGLVLRDQGELEQSVAELRQAVAADPRLAPAYNDLGVTLKKLGRDDEALLQYQRALEIDPALAQAHNNVGSLVASRGQLQRAMEHFRQALAADPHHAEAHNNLGLALRMTGGRDEAIPHFRAALANRPDWAVPMNELAWILATHPSATVRDPAQALRLSKRAVELTSGRQPVFLDTYAAALASNGDFAGAVETAERAAVIASTRRPRLATEIRSRLRMYRQSKPFIEAEGTRAAPR